MPFGYLVHRHLLYLLYSVASFNLLICHLVTLGTEIIMYRNYIYLDPVFSVPSFILPNVMRIYVPSIFYTNFQERHSFYLDPVLSVPSFIMPSIMRIDIPSLSCTNFLLIDMPFGLFVWRSSVVPRLIIPGPSFVCT